jgi:hypothetical protein
MSGPHRTTVGQIARTVATDVDTAVENLPTVVEALDHADRTVRLTAMWALVVVPEFRPEAHDGVVAQAKSHAAVEAQFVVDVLTDSDDLGEETTAGDGGSVESAGGDLAAPGDAATVGDSAPTAGDAGPATAAADQSAGASATDGPPAFGDEPGPDGSGPETTDQSDDEPRLRLAPEAREVVQTVVEEMWRAPERTPSLLRLLAHDRRHVRLTAMWAVALVAEHHPTNVDHLAARARQHDSREVSFLVDILDYYHDVSPAEAAQVDAAIAPPEQQLDRTLWGPYITYPTVEDRVVGEQSNTFTPDSTTITAVNSVELVGLSHHERVYVVAGTVDDEYTKFNLHTYVPEGRYAIKEFQRGFQPAIDGWTAVDGLDHVVSVHAHGRTPHPWVATDYLPRPLWEVGQLPPRAAVETAVELCDAVATMHQGGTAHGAVSPWSVGVVQTTSAYVPRFTRVGMAANLGGPQALRIDERFAPPEALSEEYGSVGRLSDIYGLGVTLYRLLTGDAPPYPRDLDGRFVPVDVPDPSTAVPELPAAIDPIVQTATATEKPWRYESATRLAQQLRGLLEDR